MIVTKELVSNCLQKVVYEKYKNRPIFYKDNVVIESYISSRNIMENLLQSKYVYSIIREIAIFNKMKI